MYRALVNLAGDQWLLFWVDQYGEYTLVHEARSKGEVERVKLTLEASNPNGPPGLDPAEDQADVRHLIEPAPNGHDPMP